jgi:hypothetical protein
MSIALLKVLMMLWVSAVEDRACDGKVAGSRCQAKLEEGEREGVCLGASGALSCMPAPPPMPSPRSP